MWKPNEMTSQYYTSDVFQSALNLLDNQPVEVFCVVGVRR